MAQELHTASHANQRAGAVRHARRRVQHVREGGVRHKALSLQGIRSRVMLPDVPSSHAEDTKLRCRSSNGQRRAEFACFLVRKPSCGVGCTASMYVL